MENTETHNTSTLNTHTKGLFDLSILEEMDDIPYLIEMLKILLAEAPKDIKEMKAALQSGNLETVYKNAHKLKSSSGIIQAEYLTAVLDDIEIIAKTNVGKFELSELVETALCEYNSIEKGLKTYLENLK